MLPPQSNPFQRRAALSIAEAQLVAIACIDARVTLDHAGKESA